MKLIDADALLAKFNKKADIWSALTDEETASDFALYCKVADAVEEMPTIDAVPVVRCKDCKHYMTIYCTCDGCCISPDWYCAEGERREE